MRLMFIRTPRSDIAPAGSRCFTVTGNVIPGKDMPRIYHEHYECKSGCYYGSNFVGICIIQGWNGTKKCLLLADCLSWSKVRNYAGWIESGATVGA